MDRQDAAGPRVVGGRRGHGHIHRHGEAAKPPRQSRVHGRDASALDGFARALPGVA